MLTSSLSWPRAAETQAGHLCLDEALSHRSRHRDAVMAITDVVDISNLGQCHRWKFLPAQLLQRDAHPAAAAPLLPRIELGIELIGFALRTLNVFDIDLLDSG